MKIRYRLIKNISGQTPRCDQVPSVYSDSSRHNPPQKPQHKKSSHDWTSHWWRLTPRQPEDVHRYLHASLPNHWGPNSLLLCLLSCGFSLSDLTVGCCINSMEDFNHPTHLFDLPPAEHCRLLHISVVPNCSYVKNADQFTSYCTSKILSYIYLFIYIYI